MLTRDGPGSGPSATERIIRRRGVVAKVNTDDFALAVKDASSSDGRVRTYTADRIERSFASVGRVLARYQIQRGARALDVGCGAGFDSFALRAHFEHVVAVDKAVDAIREARRVARRARVTDLDFISGDATAEVGGTFDLVWCNLMSHNVRSRLDLLAELASVVSPGGWLIYAEECEGYGPREIDAAVSDTNFAGLVARLRQVRNGILGRPAFRFFLAGTANLELELLGMAVQGVETEDWHGLTTLHRVFARRVGGLAPTAQREDRDYTILPAELRWLRAEAMAVPTSRARERQPVLYHDPSAVNSKPLAALLLYQLMLDEVPSALRQGPSFLERAAARLPSVGSHAPDWKALHDVNAEAISHLASAKPCASSS